ncbi:MAG: hypothetical protein ACQCN4_09685 [Candidatus Bathyarchaeia archaeon]
MVYSNDKIVCSKEVLVVSLKDVPLEVRRQEATKPLFLVRYE